MTPDGKKRDINSFVPFLIGSRVCSGKPFAEMIVRLTVPSILFKYDIDFVDKVKPNLNIDTTGDHDIFVKISQANFNK